MRCSVSAGHLGRTPPHPPSLAGYLEVFSHSASASASTSASASFSHELKTEATQAQDGPWLLVKAAGGRGEGRVSSSSTFSPAPPLHKGPLSEHKGPWREASQGAQQQGQVSSHWASRPSKHQGRNRPSSFADRLLALGKLSGILVPGFPETIRRAKVICPISSRNGESG